MPHSFIDKLSIKTNYAGNLHGNDTIISNTITQYIQVTMWR